MTVHGEIYKRTDADGNTSFSDSPLANYHSGGYGNVQHDSTAVDHKALEGIAKRLKKERLQREKSQKKALANRLKKHKQQQKLLAAAKKRKQACRLARKKEDLAFRKRTQRQSLNKMQNAFSNYEKKRDIRETKCQ